MATKRRGKHYGHGLWTAYSVMRQRWFLLQGGDGDPGRAYVLDQFETWEEADRAARRLVEGARDAEWRSGARDPRRSLPHAKQTRISEKIRKLRHEGYPQRQAIAIAYRMEGVSRRTRDPK